MSQYSDPDQWIKTSQVPWGTDPSHSQSIQDSWTETNRAAFGALAAVTGAGRDDLVNLIAQQIWVNTSVEYENQKDAQGNPLPLNSGQGARDTMARSFQATNGQVYRNADALAQLNAKVDALAAAVQALSDKLGSSGN